MPISLTREQLLERLAEPRRVKLLAIALNEDTKQVFPVTRKAKIPVDTNEIDIDIDISQALIKLSSKWLLRAVNLAYETLDE